MRIKMKAKRYMGIGGLMIPIPRMIVQRGLKKGVSGAKAKADLLSVEERTIHHFIVKKMAVAKTPVTVEQVGKELDVSVDSVEEIIDKLEAMKTFIYRSDGKRINWAYPLSLENTGHKMTVNTGESCFAA